MRALVVGGGIFGVTAALELRARGLAVTLVDPGPLPHPLAESTDISKVIRCDYGADEDYTLLGERALDGWRRWNTSWPTPRFHETGVAFLSRTAMQPGGFEHASFELLARRGHAIERLDETAITDRFPAYRGLVDGYYHREGGWAESGAVVADLAKQCEAAGVSIMRAEIDRVPDDHEHVVVCAGAWTQTLVPELAGMLRAVGQPVFHLEPRDPALFHANRFPVFGADISRTGYYGFPIHEGIVKIANHGVGVPDPSERATTPHQERALREFLRETIPALADAPLRASRLCVYGDSLDGHFWIDRHPARPSLTVAAGGSGHAFKFAPILGALIADAVLGEPHPKFRWRTPVASRGDAARSDHQ